MADNCSCSGYCFSSGYACLTENDRPGSKILIKNEKIRNLSEDNKMVGEKEVARHVNGDVDKVLELVKHIKEHAQKAKELYNSGTIKEFGEIEEHLLQIDAKIHELYHHITEKEVDYDPQNDLALDKKE